MAYLTTVTETYRMENDEEVKRFLEELKKDPSFEIVKYNSVKKEKKKQGEIIDEWVRFSVTKRFNDEKEPDFPIKISYEKDI